jgi:hypothetical protein
MSRYSKQRRPPDDEQGELADLERALDEYLAADGTSPAPPASSPPRRGGGALSEEWWRWFESLDDPDEEAPFGVDPGWWAWFSGLDEAA